MAAWARGFIQAMKVLDVDDIDRRACGWNRAGRIRSGCGYSKERHQFGRSIASFRRYSLSWPIWYPDRRSATVDLSRGSHEERRQTGRLGIFDGKLYASEVAVRVAEGRCRYMPAYGLIKDYLRKKYCAIQSYAPSARGPARFSDGNRTPDSEGVNHEGIKRTIKDLKSMRRAKSRLF